MTVLRKILWLLNVQEKRGALILFLMTMVGTLLEMLGVGLVIPLLAVLVDPAPIIAALPHALAAPLATFDRQQLAIGVMLLLLSVYTLKTLVLAYLAYRQSTFAFGVASRLSNGIFERYLHVPYIFHLQRNSAELIRTATGDISIFTFNIMLPSLYLLAETMVLTGLICLLLIMETRGALIIIGVLGGAGVIFYTLTKRHLHNWGHARQFHDGKRIQHLQQGLGGIKEVMLLSRQTQFLHEFSEHNAAWARASQWHAMFLQFPKLWFELLAVAALVVMMLIGMSEEAEKTAAVIPALGLFAAAAFRALPSANRILAFLQQIRYGASVLDTLQTESTGHDTQKVLMPTDRSLQGDIALNRVAYYYPESTTPALDDISLLIRQGESVAFVGPSGSGKSTAADVLMGLLAPASGRITVGGQDVALHIANWRREIGYVPQTIFLTDDSLCRNIAFGLPHADINLDAVWRALEAAQLKEFVMQLPEGIETRVGERGVRLSGGQRQRIGIARALYHDPAVLVLDEATSALDTETESEVMRAVDALHGQKTLIIIAHRLTTISGCDHVYRFDNGRLAKVEQPARSTD